MRSSPKLPPPNTIIINKTASCKPGWVPALRPRPSELFRVLRSVPKLRTHGNKTQRKPFTTAARRAERPRAPPRQRTATPLPWSSRAGPAPRPRRPPPQRRGLARFHVLTPTPRPPPGYHIRVAGACPGPAPSAEALAVLPVSEASYSTSLPVVPRVPRVFPERRRFPRRVSSEARARSPSHASLRLAGRRGPGLLRASRPRSSVEAAALPE